MRIELTSKEIKKSLAIGGKISILMDDNFTFEVMQSMSMETIVKSMNIKGLVKAELTEEEGIRIEYNEEFVVDVLTEYSSLICSLVGLVKPIINVFKSFQTKMIDIVTKYMVIEEEEVVEEEVVMDKEQKEEKNTCTPKGLYRSFDMNTDL